MPAKVRPFVAQRVDGHHFFGVSIDLKAVPVDDGAEIVRFMMCSGHSGFPHASLLLLTVAHDAENTVWLAIHFGGKSHTEGHAQTLSEATRTGFNAWQMHLITRMSLQSATQFTQGKHLIFGEITSSCQSSI